MQPYITALGFIWIIFILVWLAGILTTKRAARRGWTRALWLRLLMVVIVLVAFQYGVHHGIITYARLSGIVFNPALNALGVVLAASGVALAVWARVYLGRNWGMPMSLRHGHELVTTGPYAWVRHPIYTGVLLAALGSALVELWWLAILFVSAVYFIYSTRQEEKDMTAQFPDAYPAYKARTKTLVPFIF